MTIPPDIGTGLGYIAYMTPKAYDAGAEQLLARYPDLEIVSSPEPYMDMLNGATKAEIDSTVWIVPKVEIKPSPLLGLLQ